MTRASCLGEAFFIISFIAVGTICLHVASLPEGFLMSAMFTSTKISNKKERRHPLTTAQPDSHALGISFIRPIL